MFMFRRLLLAALFLVPALWCYAQDDKSAAPAVAPAPVAPVDVAPTDAKPSDVAPKLTTPYVSTEIALAEPLDFTVRDEERSRDIPLRAFIPADGGPFPVIIFSHGLGGSREVGGDLLGYWAKRGYVVLAPTHRDAGILQELRGRDRDGMRELLTDELTDPDNWKQRVRDVSVIIDAMPALSDSLPALKGKMDATRVGLAGHSYGAFTTMLAAGTTVAVPEANEPGVEIAMPEERPLAYLVLSGQGVGDASGNGALSESSWSKIDKPMMVMSGSRDYAMGSEGDPETRLDAYKFAPNGDKYMLWIEDAAHMSFTGRGARMAQRWGNRGANNNGDNNNGDDGEGRGFRRRMRQRDGGEGDGPGGGEGMWPGREDAPPSNDDTASSSTETGMRQQRRRRNNDGEGRGRMAGLFAPPAENEAEIFSSIQQTSLAFWDAYLKKDQSANAWLHSDQPAAASTASARWEHK